MRASRGFGALVGLVLCWAATPALASIHLVKLVEVFPGTTAAPTAQYIVLQMYSGGQNFSNGSAVQVYNANGDLVGQTLFTADVANGLDQDTLLIATPAAQTLFNLTADLTLTAALPLTGGKVCFVTYDCVAWGNYTAADTVPFARALRPNEAIKRRLDIVAPDTTLGSGDDTNNSENDFRFGAPAPVNNARIVGTTPPSTCANGTIEGLEGCDDMNVTAGDGCSATCVVERCGDLVVNNTTETCDDGNATNGDGCDSNCTITACGNGIIAGTETCDDANLTSGDGCDANCKPTGCGNGVVTAGEPCDDGNLTSGDGCDSNCTATGCGNGVVTQGEACDPPNGTTCSASCQAACILAIDCGDTDLCTANERCQSLVCVVDPVPTTDNEPCTVDGCTATGGVFHTALSDGETCTLSAMPTTRALCVDAVCGVARCGDGFVDVNAPAGPEQCDDGNAIDSDDCTNACTTPRCGDAIVQTPEQCDDGNGDANDGCNVGCVSEVCGDGIQQTSEGCDDGNTVPEDGCSVVCQAERCGDGVVQVTEDCDDGNPSDEDACSTLCTVGHCGDGLVQADEDCDDANTINGDGCDFCQRVRSGCETGSSNSPAALLGGLGVLALVLRRRRRA